MVANVSPVALTWHTYVPCDVPHAHVRTLHWRLFLFFFCFPPLVFLSNQTSPKTVFSSKSVLAKNPAVPKNVANIFHQKFVCQKIVWPKSLLLYRYFVYPWPPERQVLLPIPILLLSIPILLLLLVILLLLAARFLVLKLLLLLVMLGAACYRLPWNPEVLFCTVSLCFYHRGEKVTWNLTPPGGGGNMKLDTTGGRR